MSDEAEALEDWADFDDEEDGEYFCVNRGAYKDRLELRKLLSGSSQISGSKRKSSKQKVQYSDGSVRDETVVAEFRGLVITKERQIDVKNLYEVAKAAKIGSVIVCPVCKEKHTKTTYHKVFCSNGRKTSKDCKSKYHNTIHPERLDRVF